METAGQMQQIPVLINIIYVTIYILKVIGRSIYVSIKLYKVLLQTIGGILPQSNHPMGSVGKKFRGWCAKHIAAEFGEDVNIEKGASIQPGVVLKEKANVGVNCLVGPKAEIGAKVMMAPECHIYTRNKKFRKDLKRFKGYEEIKPVIIEEDVWIGARVIIVPGVRIGKGCVVAAGAVVSKDMPPYHVVAGNPARAVKNLLE